MNESNQAHVEIMTSLAAIKQELVGVNEHLGILNGKVATQEGKIGAMQIRDARADGKREGSKTIIIGLWVIASTILSACGATFLEHILK